MAEKVTIMVLKVDLQCPSCCKKIKKVLAKFPQIRSQAYDEKQNTVTITVVCWSPEEIRDKLCCKGGKTIKSIEIKEPPKPKVPEKPKEPEKPKQPEKPKEPEKPPPLALAPAPPIYAATYPMYPVPACCGPCSGGYHGGPCYQGYGRPVPSYDGYGGSMVNYNYGSRPDEYFNDENATGCIIM